MKQLLLILAAVLCVMFVMTFTYRHIVIRYAIVAVILAVMFVNRKKNHRLAEEYQKFLMSW